MSDKRIVLALVFALGCVMGCAHQATQEKTLRSTVLMSTNKAGSHVVTTNGETITVDFEYNDRGRGPRRTA